MKSGSTSSLILPSRAGAPPPVAWRTWPLVEPTASGIAAVLGVGIAVAAAARWTTGGWQAAAIACLCLALVAWRLFLPVVFEASALGITQQVFGWRWRVPWQTIERAELGPHGVQLFFYESRVGLGRSLYLACPDQTAALEDSLRYFLGVRAIEPARPDRPASAG